MYCSFSDELDQIAAEFTSTTVTQLPAELRCNHAQMLQDSQDDATNDMKECMAEHQQGLAELVRQNKLTLQYLHTMAMKQARVTSTGSEASEMDAVLINHFGEIHDSMRNMHLEHTDRLDQFQSELEGWADKLMAFQDEIITAVRSALSSTREPRVPKYGTADFMSFIQAGDVESVKLYIDEAAAGFLHRIPFEAGTEGVTHPPPPVYTS